ncbi:hypothetical protein LPJ61_000235 [Coemansia biformis]|uniref:Acetyl-CoA synthetase-like protein n=1 Tax=Coemansia biformis TaxID=1286918 RepID=A0A9W7YIS2_9FUNG|nr:hypothetical protein LPJ61_000235 [Coemansia biformis]
MTSRVEQSAFDELPIVYQARVRDIQQELEDGEITQKGFDKRLATIMQEYHATLAAARGPEPTAGPLAPAPPVRARDGSKRAFYDARKSTVLGFKKPGINFEALLDEMEEDDNDAGPGVDLAAATGAAALASANGSSANSRASSRLSSHFSFNFGSPQPQPPPVPELPLSARPAYRDDDNVSRFDVDLSTGRAYNVLNDIMDPYCAPSSGGDRHLYLDAGSTSSRSSSILDELGSLGPSEFNPDVITQGAMPRPPDALCDRGAHSAAASGAPDLGDGGGSGGGGGDDDEVAFVASSVEIKRMNSLMYPHHGQGPTLPSAPRPIDIYQQAPDQSGSRAFPRLPSTESRLQRGPGPARAAEHTAPVVESPPGDGFTNGDARFRLQSGTSGVTQGRPAPLEDLRPEAVLVPTALAAGAPSMSTEACTTRMAASDISLLTPDTPNTHLFAPEAFTIDSVVQAQVKPGSASSPAELPGLTPMPSGVFGASSHERGFQPQSQPRPNAGDTQPRHSSLGAAAGSRAARQSHSDAATLEDIAAAAESSAVVLEHLSQEHQLYEGTLGFEAPTSDSRASRAESSTRDSYSHWVDYVAAADPSANGDGDEAEHEPGHNVAEQPPVAGVPLYDDDCLAADLEQSLGFSESLAAYTHGGSATHYAAVPDGPTTNGTRWAGQFGSQVTADHHDGGPVLSSRAIDDSDTDDGQVSEHDSFGNPQHDRQQQQQQRTVVDNRTRRRPTYGARLDRRPTNSFAVAGAGRVSYYAADAELEIPASFDMQMLALGSPGTPSAALSGTGGGRGSDAHDAHNGLLHADGSDFAFGGRDAFALQVEHAGTLASTEDSGGTHMAAAVPAMGPMAVDTGSAPILDLGKDPTAVSGYSYDQYDQQVPNDWEAGVQHSMVDGSHQQQQHQQQQQQEESGGIGAIIYPREIPSAMYSGKLKHLMAAHANLPSVLRYRASATPSAIAYTCIDAKGREVGSWTWAGLHARAVQVAQLLRQRGVSAWGERIALVYRKYEVLDFVGSIFGCFYAGMCAVPVVAGDSYAELVHVLSSTSAALVLTTELNIKALNKDLAQTTGGMGWPTNVPWVRTDNLGGCVLSPIGAQNPSNQFYARPAADAVHSSQLDAVVDAIKPEDLAYVEFSKSPNGELKGVQITHGAIMRQCATWIVSTGMLDIGRKYKHRVELEEGETAAGQDYALGLADPDNELDADSSPSAPQSVLDAPGALPLLADSISAASAPASEPDAQPGRSSLGKKWGGSSGFLGRLRNVGSLPKLRRGSRGRESAALSSRDGTQASRTSVRSSLIGTPFGSGRIRAASNLSTVSHPQEELAGAAQRSPALATYSPATSPRLGQREHRRASLASKATASADAQAPFGAGAGAGAGVGAGIGTPSANVAVFNDVVASYIEPRQHFGLVYGIFGGCYGGHQSIYASSVLCDIAGAYISLLTRYRVTVAVGDYAGLQSVLSAAIDEPDQIFGYNRKIGPNLARLRLCLIDTLFIDPVFHAAFDKNVLHPFGCPYQGIASTEGHPVVTPVCTLAEHGSALMAMRDCLASASPFSMDVGSAAQRYEFVLDRQAFKENRIVVLPDERTEAEVDRIGTTRYQSFGFPALSATVAVVDPETRELCAPDAIGELWIDSPALGSGFWGLPKLSSSIFSARFTYNGADGTALVTSGVFLRTGLMGAVVQDQVLVFGFYEDRIRTLTVEPAAGAAVEPAAWLPEPTLGFHYAGDINSTIRRYLPQVTECAAFEMYSNDTHFPVIAAEIRHNSGKYATVAEEIYSVLRTRHGLYAYAVALCPPDTLPRAFQYGKRTVNAQLCRHQFESGKVNCLYVKITTDHLFLNLPPPAFTLADGARGAAAAADPSVAIYGPWLQQTSLEAGMPSVDEASGMDLTQFRSITELLAWRVATTPEQVAYAPFDERGRPLKPMTFRKLMVKVSAAALLLLEKKFAAAGKYVIVAMAPSPSFVVAVHACLAIGAVPIAIAPPDIDRLAEDMPPLLATAREYGATCILADAQSEEVFRSKLMEAAMRVRALRALLAGRGMPPVVSLARAPKSPKHTLGRGWLQFDPQWADPARTALVMQFTGAQASTPQYVGYSHRALLGHCAQQKGDFQMLAAQPVISSVRAYNGYGLLHCCVIGVYMGCMTLLLTPAHFFAAPNVWFELVHRYKVKDAFATLPMLNHAMSLLAARGGQHSFSLGAVRNLIVAAEERVDPQAFAEIGAFFARYGLGAAAVNPLYGTLMNPCISTRAYLGVSPLTLHLDIHALRRGAVVAVPPPGDATEDPHHRSLTLQDSGKVSGSTMVAIVDPATRRVLPAGSIGEVWVCSASNALHRRTLPPAGAAPVADDATGLLDGNGTDVFVRTGDLGFLYLQVALDAPGGAPAEPYLFVAGKVSETFTVDGYMYFYSDIERAAAELSEDVSVAGCVVVQTTLPASPVSGDGAPGTTDPAGPRLRLVAVLSLRRAPSDSFLPNAACLIFNNVLDRHQVLLDEIVFVPRDALPRSRIPERRRRTVRGLYESGKLKTFVSIPISSSPTLPSGLANPNNRHSFLGMSGLLQ